MKLIEYIRKNRIEKTISNLKLSSHQKDNLILLKYNQIKSDLRKDVVKESRGIIIDINTLKVISFPFKRFVNHTDYHKDNIDWKTARIQKKLDGSLMQLYYYDKKWRVGTSGTLDASGFIGESNITYNDLFFSLFDEEKLNKLNTNYNYIFELTTNLHTIVTTFEDNNITLLTVRNLLEIDNSVYGELNRKDCEKISKQLNIDIIEEYPMNSLEELLKSFKTMKFTDEGYVVVDDNFNRLKVKNPAWNAAHHNKGNKLNINKLIDIVKSNEIIEFVEAYPNTKYKLLKLKEKYNKIINFLDYVKENKKKLNNKELAGLIYKEISERNLNKSLIGMTFSYLNNYIDKDVYDFLYDTSNKVLMKYL